MNQFPLVSKNFSLEMNSRISLVFISWVLVFEIPSSSSPIDWYTICSTHKFNCGNITNIGFPFWGGDRPERCGHPTLKMVCEGNVVVEATIEIKEVKYKVMEMNRESKTVRIARSDYMENLCPTKFINTSIDYNLFESINGYSNITLLYCSSSTTAGQFSCPKYGIGLMEIGAIGPRLCNESVIMPVSFSGLSGVVNSTEILAAIKEGFEVKWKDENERGCGDCEESKGVCGYDFTLNQTTCYCSGYSTGIRICPNPTAGEAPTTATPSKGNVKLKVAFGVSAGFVGLAVTFLHYDHIHL